MADKLDRIIGDYVNGRLEARIKSIESRYLYKQKVDNLGIRTAYSGGSEPESNVLNKEALENDEEYIKLKDLMYQFNLWYDSLIYNEKEIVRLKHFGYGGLTWYRVIMELDNEVIEISEKKLSLFIIALEKTLTLILLVSSEIMGQIGRKIARFWHEIGTSTLVFADILVL